MEMMIKVRNLEKSYPAGKKMYKVLNDINLMITKGEFVALMGPSGCGKTTLLNAIGLIDNNNFGEIEIAQNPIKKLKSKKINEIRKENIGFIFQEYNLIDTLNAYDNIALALTLSGKKNIDQSIKRVANILNIEKILDKFTEQLSGGEKQRVAIARALVTEPKILFCDEPTGALDQTNGKDVIEYLKKVNEELNITVVMVTHDAYYSAQAQRVIFMRDGKLFSEIRKQHGVDTRDFLDIILSSESDVRG